MGDGCGVKYIFYIITFLQIISTMERQIFDFLGFMWVPILVPVPLNVFFFFVVTDERCCEISLAVCPWQGILVQNRSHKTFLE
jgi:Na,K-Atpase Interacting protein